MDYKKFKDYLTDRQLREEAEAIKVDPATKMAQQQSGRAVAKTLQTTNVDVAKTQDDPRMKNRLLGKAMQKATAGGQGAHVNVRSIADKIDPNMKV